MHVVVPTNAFIWGMARMISWTRSLQLGRGAKKKSSDRFIREPALLYVSNSTYSAVRTLLKEEVAGFMYDG